MILFLGACQNETPEVIEPNNEEEVVTPLEKDRTYKKREDVKLSEKEMALSEVQSDFSFRFFEEYEKLLNRKNLHKENFVVSPFSVHQTLSMLANGLTDEKIKETLSILLPEKASVEDLNAYNRHIVDALADLDNYSDVVVSNSLWTNTGYSVNEDFSKAIGDAYDAEALSADLFSFDGMKKVNKWIEKKTFGLIPQLFDNPPYVSATLVNTIFFKSGWWNGTCDLSKGEFNNIDGSIVNTDFFSYPDILNSYKDDSYNVVSLKYGNSAFRLNIILPGKDDMDVSMANITHEDWKRIKESFEEKRIEFYIPKFDVAKKEDIIEVVYGMGLSEIFDGRNLQKISSDIEGFNSILHSAKLKVDEKGSEGAAATAGGWLTGDGLGTKEIFRADRPFMFILDEVSTGTILFMGRINKI